MGDVASEQVRPSRVPLLPFSPLSVTGLAAGAVHAAAFGTETVYDRVEGWVIAQEMLDALRKRVDEPFEAYIYARHIDVGASTFRGGEVT